ncbi:DUF3027 domain-containing protein [Demequina salsinemoris]|uniref:DUF3027 domain-containing protein n=1 Tax=Demequina salsinemoris TaxID=577470 RepID=UPI000A02E668|nr:DUF3027 domain-containing protein [Demequina salsinemoris]
MAVDSVLAAAVDVAREAAVEAAGDAAAVGEHLSANDEGDKLVTHLFGCTLPGYRGWVWSVTLSRTPRLKTPNICEANLVPADDALLAPTWIPWADRVQPGDLEPSMVLPRVDNDGRLMPGYEATGDEDADALAIWELGLGRERVLAPRGRDEAAERWYRGSHGPTAASAIASTAACSTCAFFIPLTGSMRTEFGACSNEWSPSDGSVVSVDHGCGAHSQTDVERPGSQWPANDPVYIDESSDPFDLAPEPEPEPEPVPEALTEAGADDVVDEPVADAVVEAVADEAVAPDSETAVEAEAEAAEPATAEVAEAAEPATEDVVATAEIDAAEPAIVEVGAAEPTTDEVADDEAADEAPADEAPAEQDKPAE